MEREHPSPAVGENELHAFAEGRLPAARRYEVVAHLDAHPDVADRVAAYLHQRDALARLGRCLAAEPIPPRLAGLETALVEAMRRRRRARRTVAATGAVALAAAVGWLASGRPARTATPA